MSDLQGWRARIAAFMLMAVTAAGLNGCSDPQSSPVDPPDLGLDRPSPPPVVPVEIVPAWWAKPISTGTVMWQVTDHGWTITGYDMGEDTAKSNGNFSDDETGLLLVEQGDPIVFVNVVATNTSDQTLYVGLKQPALWATPVDRPYTLGLADVTGYDRLQGDAHGVYQDNLNVPVIELPRPMAPEVPPGFSFARGYALPLKYGREFAFAARLWTHETLDTVVGHWIDFEQRFYTFP